MKICLARLGQTYVSIFRPKLLRCTVLINAQSTLWKLSKYLNSLSYAFTNRYHLAVAGVNFVTIVDATSFFYQFLVAERDRDKFTVVSHRGQEHFKVAVMGFKNSPAYVQRRIEIIFRPFREFARPYIDDIVIFSASFEEHMAQLHRIFSFFQSIGMRLSPKKSYFCEVFLSPLYSVLLSTSSLVSSVRLEDPFNPFLLSSPLPQNCQSLSTLLCSGLRFPEIPCLILPTLLCSEIRFAEIAWGAEKG